MPPPSPPSQEPQESFQKSSFQRTFQEASPSPPPPPMPPLPSPSLGLLPFKLWYLIAFAGMACFTPYLAIFYRRSGLSEGEIGGILAMQQVVSLPTGAVWGVVVDYTQKPKEILLFTHIIASITRFAVGWGKGFWQYFWLSCIIASTGSNSAVLVDVLALRALPDESDYGKLRLWGAVGWGLMSPLAGLLIDVIGMHSIFYSHLVLMSLCALVTTQLKEDGNGGKEPQKGLQMVEFFSALKTLFSRPSVAAFFAVVLVMGMATGSMNYVFLYLEELGGNTTLMGLTLTIMCAAEVPAMYLSGTAVRTFGVSGVLCLVFIAYIVRLLYYSWIWNPWMVLPIEVLHGITFGWGFSVGTTHAGSIAPPELSATTQVLFNITFFNVGSGLGSLLAGYVYERFGAVYLFRLMAAGVSLSLLLFAGLTFTSREPPTPPLEEPLIVHEVLE